MFSGFIFARLREIILHQQFEPEKLFRKGNEMEEEQDQAGPVVSEFKGKPVLRIPTVDNPDPNTSWHWLSFGKNKAKAIVKYFDAIKKFAEE